MKGWEERSNAFKPEEEISESIIFFWERNFVDREAIEELRTVVPADLSRAHDRCI